jgi:hypothetical protein
MNSIIKKILLCFMLLQASKVYAVDTIFEMQCQITTPDGRVYITQRLLPYDHRSGINLRMHTDFLDDLEHGFCILGPVDYQKTIDGMKAQFNKYIQEHPNPLDQIQNPEIPRIK